mmetsp:Transcript_36650/g.117831  ORF Transcript_36650/g.117831 Transcript_36650/m.117831 type:complete len:208 (+) Transcript_36650:1876-2499(+)
MSVPSSWRRNFACPHRPLGCAWRRRRRGASMARCEWASRCTGKCATGCLRGGWTPPRAPSSSRTTPAAAPTAGPLGAATAAAEPAACLRTTPAAAPTAGPLGAATAAAEPAACLRQPRLPARGTTTGRTWICFVPGMCCCGYSGWADIGSCRCRPRIPRTFGAESCPWRSRARPRCPGRTCTMSTPRWATWCRCCSTPMRTACRTSA